MGHYHNHTNTQETPTSKPRSTRKQTITPNTRNSNPRTYPQSNNPNKTQTLQNHKPLNSKTHKPTRYQMQQTGQHKQNSNHQPPTNNQQLTPKHAIEPQYKQPKHQKPSSTNTNPQPLTSKHATIINPANNKKLYHKPNSTKHQTQTQTNLQVPAIRN